MIAFTVFNVLKLSTSEIGANRNGLGVVAARDGVLVKINCHPQHLVQHGRNSPTI
ncbi:MAG TPA: hypothetical protein V6D35_16750 [Candidatus Sericytochromatia bacterium]